MSKSSSPAPTRAEPRVFVRFLGMLALYAVATLIGGAIFVALMRTMATMGPGVMFYRGLAALGAGFLVLFFLCAALTKALPKLRLDVADAFGAAVVATSLLLAGFIVGPITVDRSISVFVLAQFDAADRPLKADEMREKFVRIYAGDWDQIGRRLVEQQVSGNLEQTPEGWRLTPQGKRFMELARQMSAIFGGDPRFVGR